MHCTEKIAGSVSAERVGQGQHSQGVVHMVGARVGCNRGMVGTGWGNSRPFTTIRMC